MPPPSATDRRAANAPPARATALHFGPFELRPLERLLSRNGERVVLGSRAMDLLSALARRAGQVIDKRTLIAHVWPGLVVADNNLAAQVRTLRRVLGADAIATVPGRGYCFTARMNLPLDAAAQRDRMNASPASADAAELRPTSHPHSGRLAPRRNAFRCSCGAGLLPVADSQALRGAIAAASSARGNHGEATPAGIGTGSTLTLMVVVHHAAARRTRVPGQARHCARARCAFACLPCPRNR